MCRPPRTGDNDLDAGRLGAFGKSEQPVRGAMCGDDVLFACDAERGQRFGGMAHGPPVGLASHDDGYGRGHTVNSFRESKNIGRIIRSAQASARRGKRLGMDYPVLVNPGKPLRDVDEEENQGERSRCPKTPKKRCGGTQGGSQGARRVKVPLGSAPRLSVAPNDAKLAIRRLKV